MYNVREHMHDPLGILNGRQGYISALPLFVCYVLFPLSFISSEILDFSFFRNWIDVFWTLLGYFCIIVNTFFLATTSRPLLFSIWLATFGAFLCVATYVLGLAPFPVFFMEIKPIFYFLVALFFVWLIRSPTPDMYCRMGMWLSLILIGEVMIAYLSSGLILRPIGSGEVNYDAALICLSLFFALGSKKLSRKYTLVLFTGLIASLSRTSLLAACVILFFSKVVPLPIRIFMIVAALSAITFSFAIRGLDLGALTGLDRYWMWYSALLYFADYPIATSLELLPGSPLDVIVPDPVAALWESQQQNLNIEGIFPFHFHSMWLRLALSWGWLPVLFLLFNMLFISVFKSREYSDVRGFFGFILVLGLTMGVVYNGNVALPFLLAAFHIFRPRYS